jgi:hypothetical protein
LATIPVRACLTAATGAARTTRCCATVQIPYQLNFNSITTSEPTTPQIALAVDQFHASDVTAAIEAHPHLTLNELRNPLHVAADLARAECRHSHAAILDLTSHICSMMLQPAVQTAPLAPFATWGDGTCSMGPEHLQPEQLDFIASVADIITHRTLRARLSDLVWLKAKRHGNRFALRAVDDYRAASLQHATWHTHGRTSWHHALQLAVSLRGAASERLEAMVTDLASAFFAHKDEDGVVALLARREADRPHPFNAAACFHSAIDWFKRIGDNAGGASIRTTYTIAPLSRCKPFALAPFRHAYTR